MNDDEALLWDKSRRKRDLDDKEAINNAKTTKLDKDAEVGVPSTSDEDKTKVDTPIENNETNLEISIDKLKEDVYNEAKFTNEEIHAKLKAVDPKMAERLHPNNRRKVLR